MERSVNYSGRFSDSIMFLRELRRMMPHDRHNNYRKPRSPTPVPSPSLTDLQLAIDSATRIPSERRPISTHRAIEAAARGETVSHAAAKHALVPSVCHHDVDAFHSRVYGARFVGECGERFVTSSQYKCLRVYHTSMSESRAGWKRTHIIPAHAVRWTITDFDVSPDGRWLAYASLNSFVHLVDLDRPRDPQIMLDFSFAGGGRGNIWSLRWGHDGSEIIVGTGSSYMKCHGAIIVYDVQLRRIVDAIPAHDDDVNSVCFMRNGERSVLLSGSDDNLVKMWDRRDMRNRRQGEIHRSCRVFVGHQHGLTFVSSKDDGRFLLSNAKDQFIKLWDARKCASTSDLHSLKLPPRDPSFDYRVQTCPRVDTHSSFRDDSVMTYAGSHETLQTLIRAHFSPMHTTGQRYIYCGSSDGRCVVYDVVSGKAVKTLKGHDEPVRDVSWHPYGSFLTTGSWDGRILMWSTHEEPDRC